MLVLIVIIAVVVGYLSGSVSYATLISRRVSGRNIRELGSKNPGSLNVGASVGKKWGFLVGLLDGLKSFIPMLLARLAAGGQSEAFVFIATMAAGIAAILGHWKPVFHGWKGGQCVGTTIGVFLFIIPLEFLLSFVLGALFIFFVVRKLVDKWVRWVPITFVLLVPIVTALCNVFFEVSLFAHVSLGAHPWYWMAGIGAVCVLMLTINISYLKNRFQEIKRETE